MIKQVPTEVVHGAIEDATTSVLKYYSRRRVVFDWDDLRQHCWVVGLTSVRGFKPEAAGLLELDDHDRMRAALRAYLNRAMVRQVGNQITRERSPVTVGKADIGRFMSGDESRPVRVSVEVPGRGYRRDVEMVDRDPPPAQGEATVHQRLALRRAVAGRLTTVQEDCLFRALDKDLEDLTPGERSAVTAAKRVLAGSERALALHRSMG